jgi:hypothetical protein
MVKAFMMKLLLVNYKVHFSTLGLRVLDAKSFKRVKLCNSLLQG